MPKSLKTREGRAANLAALWIALVYLLVGGGWILFSDRLAARLAPDPETLIRIQSYKGWGYVLVTALLLFVLVRRSLTRLSRSEAQVKATSAELQKALQQLNFHVDNCPLAAIEWDDRFRVRHWSPRAAELFGWPAGEVIGKDLFEMGFFHHADGAAAGAMFDWLRAGRGQKAVTRLRNLSRTGQVIHCEWYNSALLEDNGKLISIFTLLHDVTTRVEAEAALRESETRFRATFEQAAVGIAHVDLDGKWLRVNRKLCAIVGYPPEELTRLSFQEITHPDDLGADLGLMARLLAGELETYSLDKRYLRKDATPVWINLTVSLVRDAAGTPQYFISVVQDISERKQLEAQFRQAQKMEAVGRLAGGVAHDFNNMLTVIDGYSSLALSALSPEDPLARKIMEIKKAGEKAAALTRQLLVFSRQQVLQPVILDLGAIVTQTGQLLKRLLGEDIELLTIVPADLGLTKADPTQIEQVIVNLAINARDAMPQGGKLALELANVQLDAEGARRHGGIPPGPYVQLTVSDTGSGMDQETLSRIFEPFFTTKEQGKGTGLGLAIVYGVVSQSDGGIEVRSEPGRGTTFGIVLPRVDGQVEEGLPAPTLAPAARAARATETVLLVEDEPSVRSLAREMLETEGYTVLEAGEGAAALHLAESHPGPVHLLLTDLVLPGLSGPRLAGRLATLRPGLKVLFMSGYADRAMQQQVETTGGIFLHKPFSRQDLLRKVRETLGREGRPPETPGA